MNESNRREFLRRAGLLSTAAFAWAPSASAAAPVIRISSSTQLKSLLKTAVGGTVFELSDGVFQSLGEVRDISKTPSIIIRGNRYSPPLFPNGVGKFIACKGICFEGLEIVGNRKDSLDFWDGEGLSLSNCDRIDVRNCLFKQFRFLLSARLTSNLAIIDNEFCYGSEDHMRLYETMVNLVVRGNYSHHHRPDFNRLSSRHPDHMQFAVNGNFTGARNVLIERNRFENDLKDGSIQGICFFHERLWGRTVNGVKYDGIANWPRIAHQDIVVRDNYLIGTFANTIALAGVDGGDVYRNVIRKYGSGVNKPTINIYRDGALNRNLNVHDNVLVYPIGQVGSLPGDKLVESGYIGNNTISPSALPIGFPSFRTGRYAGN